MAGNMTFSLLFKARDEASAVVQRLISNLAAPAHAALQTARATGMAAQQFAQSFAGIGSMVAGGFAMRDVIKANDGFTRLAITSGMSADQVSHLRDTFHDTAIAARVSGADMAAAFQGMRSHGGSIQLFEDNANTIGAAIQLMGGHADELGAMMASANKHMQLSSGPQLLQFLATARQQLKGVDGGFEAFAEHSQALMSSYAEQGHTGEKAAREVSGIYALTAMGTASPMRAARTVDGLIQSLADPAARNHLQSMGIKVFNTDANGNQDRRLGTRGISDIMQQMAAGLADSKSQFMFEDQLGPEMKAALKIAIAEIKADKASGGIGRSQTLEKMVNDQGDASKFTADAEKMKQTFSGSMNALNGSVSKFADAHLAGPVQALANGMATLEGPLGTVVVSLAGLVAVGNALGWIMSAVAAFKAFGAALGVLRLGSVVTSLIGLARVGVIVGGLRFGGMVMSLVEGAGACLALVRGIRVATAAMWLFDIAANANPIGLVVLGAAALAASAFVVWDNWKELVAWFEDKLTKLRQMFQDLADTIKNSGVGRFFGAGGPPSAAGTARWAKVTALGGPLIDAGHRSPRQGPAASEPVGIRNNNPLNLRSWQGAETKDGFAAFASPEEGISKAVKNLQNYDRRGDDTVERIIAKWAPANENNTKAYTETVSKGMGVKPGDHLDLQDPGTLSKLLSNMIKVEDGKQPYSTEALAKGIAMGLAEQPGPPPVEKVAAGLAKQEPAHQTAQATSVGDANDAMPATRQAPAAQRLEGTITVMIQGLPKEATATVKSNQPGLGVALDRGPLMAAGG